MAIIRRLTHSCLTVTTDDGTVLFDPDFHSFESGAIDLDSLGDIQHVLITHEHGDHVHPDFVRWLVDRGTDVTVHSNGTVVELLAGFGITATTEHPTGVTAEDVLHERLPTGAQPPNRSYTVGNLFTHPGDSFQPEHTAPVLALPFMAPWGSITQAVEFATRIGPRQVIPCHDWYLSEAGRRWVYGLAGPILAKAGVELVALDWGDTYSV